MDHSELITELFFYMHVCICNLCLNVHLDQVFYSLCFNSKVNIRRSLQLVATFCIPPGASHRPPSHMAPECVLLLLASSKRTSIHISGLCCRIFSGFPLFWLYSLYTSLGDKLASIKIPNRPMQWSHRGNKYPSMIFLLVDLGAHRIASLTAKPGATCLYCHPGKMENIRVSRFGRFGRRKCRKLQRLLMD